MTTATELPKINTEAILLQTKPLIERAKALKVTNVEEHAAALEDLKTTATVEKFIKDLYANPKKILHQAHKDMCADEAKYLVPIGEVRALIGGKCIAFEDIQRQKAEEIQRQAQEAARQQEEERQLADAIDAEQAGDKEGAAAILEEKVEAPVIQVAPVLATVAGVSSRVTWSAEVTDKAKLLAYVATHPEWLNLIEPNMPALNKLAQAQQIGRAHV